MERLGVGVVGLGMGRNLLRANSTDGFPAEVRAVCDIAPARREAAAREHGVAFTTDQFDALLERRDIHLVAIYTPDHLHCDQILRALEAGHHVLVTKPMTVGDEESARVVAAARRAGKTVMVAQTQRFLPFHRAVRRLVDLGEFGDIYFAASDYYQDLRPVYSRTPWRYEVPQDFLYGGLSHNIDLLRWFKGEINEVAAYGINSRLDPRYPANRCETFVLNLRFVDGTIGRIAMAPGVDPPLPNVSLQLFGTRGTCADGKVVLDSLPGQPRLSFEYKSRDYGLAELSILEDFAGAIARGAEPSVTTIDGARISAVASAAWASIQAGGAPRPVKLDW
jgi:predicted dehydrogenase